MGTIASAQAQHVQGKYNVADTTQAFIIGGGTSSSDRNNIFTIDWNGNAWIKNIVISEKFIGDLEGTADTLNDSAVLITIEDIDKICNNLKEN